ncbi:hypothetical protein VHEMI00928 [[Torrubiella] hemipterigena]|uniref:Urease accessory protein n=1 Tax=[Torrubiella] hemipterigena TaxID=1531966 RepID=A0A0A1SKL5_9HYPO|nr:hypothetical protein VHEMI00928 [[Torrubiella] hemipterigena]
MDEEMIDPEIQGIEDEIAELETRLAAAKARLLSNGGSVKRPIEPTPMVTDSTSNIANHFILLLSDSALPVGSFAFSSGLESYLVHNPRTSNFTTFLPLSISSFASTTLPFVLAACRDPINLASLDDQLDAAIICTVGRRASTSQGRALLSIWERSFRSTVPPGSTAADAQILRHFSDLLRKSNGMEIPLVSAHFGPLFGALCAIVGLSLRQTAYVFMLSHVKALLSAAVRASVFGPYQAQKVLASERVQRLINAAIDKEWHTTVEDAGQSVPIMDLWIGRHEVLYSRIFNS